MVLHEPQLDTILMVEKAVIDADDHLGKTALWRSLPRKVQYQTFNRILEYLEASGKIVYDDGKIIYTGVNSPKLQALLDSSVRVK